MLRQTFKTKEEAENYLKTEKILIENKQSKLSYSERQKIKDNQIKPEMLVLKEEKLKMPIVTDINYLRQPCQEVNKEDNIEEIIQKLKDTLENRGGLGISANQIGIKKRISYIKIPKLIKNKLEYSEYILINTKIIEKDKPIKIQNEQCLSFPDVSVTTKRYVYCTVEYYNKEMKLQTGLIQDLESITIQHEIDHNNGITIFERKWKAK